MKSRKGLSTVVGMVFALIALAISMGYITYSMNILDQYDKTVIAKNQQTIDNVKENFQLYSATISGSKFNIAITNTGNLPITITRMWVQNYTVADSVNYYTINQQVQPGSKMINIGSCIVCPTVHSTSNGYYNIKLVTSRGNSLQFNMGSPGTNPLYMQLTMIPPTLSGTFLPRNVTILYQVTNNSTSNNLLTNIVPTLSCSSGTYPAASFVLKQGPIPSQYSTLQSGSSVFFKWYYQMNSATVGSRICKASLQNGLASNFVNETIYWISS